MCTEPTGRTQRGVATRHQNPLVARHGLRKVRNGRKAWRIERRQREGWAPDVQLKYHLCMYCASSFFFSREGEGSEKRPPYHSTPRKTDSKTAEAETGGRVDLGEVERWVGLFCFLLVLARLMDAGVRWKNGRWIEPRGNAWRRGGAGLGGDWDRFAFPRERRVS